VEQLALFHESNLLFERESLDYTWFSVNQKLDTGYVDEDPCTGVPVPIDWLRQDMYPIADMPAVLDRLDYSLDSYISQHSYRTPERRIASLWALSSAHIDIDFYKSNFAGLPVEYVMEQALYRCECEGIPLPSLVIDSGRGLYLKWLWTTPLHGAALPRWQAVERELLKSFVDFEADHGATLGTQILRVEGSKNSRCGRKVGLIWSNGTREDPVRYDFDKFADLVLPYTRRQAQAYKLEMAQRGRFLEEIKANAALRDARLNRPALCAPGAAVAKQIEHDLAGERWARVYDWIQRLVVHRYGPGGVPDGAGRNEFCWLAALALAWQTTAPSEITTAVRLLVPSFSLTEARSSAAAVLNRLKAGKGLYKISNKTLIERLSVSNSELVLLGGPSGSRGLARATRPNAGVLRTELDSAFGVMRGLSFEQYVEQTKERQRRGAEYTNTERKADTRARVLAAVATLQKSGKRVSAAAVAKLTGLHRNGLMRNHRDLIQTA
jgi:hypothetical protein